MRIMAVLAVACGCVAAPTMAAGNASASPTCDGLDCVPYVARNVSLGAPCVFGTRYVFGVESGSGDTLACAPEGRWIQWKPLIGVRTLQAPCDGSPGAAQSPDGIPLGCVDSGWIFDFASLYYAKT
jgi:hypothetical protein